MPKKIVIISAVKNESDIIEYFCRYNLLYADCMLIYENNKSSDNTREIILNLVSEGLPIHFEAEESDMFYETAKGVLVDIAIDKYDADMVLQIDADEFLFHKDGINPRETLEKLRDDIEYQVPWRTYVYTEEPDESPMFSPGSYTYYRNPVLEEAQGHAGKALASRFLLKEKKARFVLGGHWLEYPKEGSYSPDIVITNELLLAHYPIRSRSQVMSKAIPNWINKWTQPEQERASREHLATFQLGKLFDELKHNGDISTETMKDASIRYSLYNMANIAEIDKLLSDLQDKVLVEGALNTAFCKEKLATRYAAQKDDRRDLLRAMLDITDTAVQHLDAESRDKTKKLYDINCRYDEIVQEKTELSRHYNELAKRNRELTDIHNELKKHYDALSNQSADRAQQIDVLNRQIADIYESNTWKTGRRIKRLIRLFIPGKKKTETNQVIEEETDFSTQIQEDGEIRDSEQEKNSIEVVAQNEPQPQVTWDSDWKKNSLLKGEEYPGAIKRFYRHHTGKDLNLDDPQTFNEKIQWAKLYDRDPLRTRLSDKYAVRDWVSQRIGEEYLIPLLGVWENADDIDYSELPERFVLKCTHGCDMNIIVKDKTQLNEQEICEKLNNWLKTNFAYKDLELQYADIPPRIIAEEYIDDIASGKSPDYKFFCFSGKPHYCRLSIDRYVDFKHNMYDMNWNLQPFICGSYPNSEQDIQKPETYEKMADLAGILATGFPFVRVDLYCIDSKILFGEMTFTPTSGCIPFTPPEYDRIFGELYELPNCKLRVDVV